VSLVYGSLAAGTKQELIREVTSSAVLAFEAARLHVWRTDGPVEDWREIGAFDFGPGRDEDDAQGRWVPQTA
jgi:hypothetical protein